MSARRRGAGDASTRGRVESVGFVSAADTGSRVKAAEAEGRGLRPSWEGLHVRLAAALYINMDIAILVLPFVIGAFQPPGIRPRGSFWLKAALTRETCLALLVLMLKWCLIPLVFKRRESVLRAHGTPLQMANCGGSLPCGGALTLLDEFAAVRAL